MLAAFAVVATLVIAAERRRTLDADEDAVPATAAGALAGVLDDALDDLRSERDPRRAVIRAYARMGRERPRAPARRYRLVPIAVAIAPAARMTLTSITMRCPTTR